MENQTKFNWKIFLTLWFASVIGILAVLPYAFTLQESVIKKITATIPLGVIIAAQIIQSIVLFGAATSIGLLLAKRTGLGAPVLEKFFAGEKIADHVKPFLLPVILFGVIGGLFIFGLDKFVFMPALKTELIQGGGASGSQTTPWQGFLASFYGGIDEEILLRLFLMSLLAWLGKFVSRTAEGKPTTGVLWAANILAAVLFGLGHLPATAAVMTITPLVIVRAIVLNGLLGIGFGYFYSKYGLESAMLSHFSADIILHVVFSI
jgi:membrane protease YdiL (CAAX protease family)